MYKVLHVKLKKKIKALIKFHLGIIHQEHLKKLFPKYGYQDGKDAELGARRPQIIFLLQQLSWAGTGAWGRDGTCMNKTDDP